MRGTLPLCSGKMDKEHVSLVSPMSWLPPLVTSRVLGSLLQGPVQPGLPWELGLLWGGCVQPWPSKAVGLQLLSPPVPGDELGPCTRHCPSVTPLCVPVSLQEQAVQWLC